MSAEPPRLTHAELCDGLGLPHAAPRPDWLPYAVQATRIEIHAAGRCLVYGGTMRCGGCDYGLSMFPGPGVSGPNGPTTAAALVVCPKCGYDGTTASLTAQPPGRGT